jgi:alpha-aminoadipate/glutamate carrier protein LysW
MAKICPECDSPLDIDVDEVDEGETLTCEECGAELEIVSVEPLEVAPVDAEGYDDEIGLPHEDEDDEDA